MTLPAKHPIWSFLNLVVILTFVTVFAYLNASEFDETEVKMLMQLLAVMGGWEWAKRKMRPSEPEED